jgi:hypothetical protein
VNVECRSSTCEILSAAKSAQEAEQAAEDWQAAVYSSPEQSWWSAFGLQDMVVTVQSDANGRVLFATYLSTQPHAKLGVR